MPLLRTLDELLDARRTALVVYDAQVGILNQIPGAAREIERAFKVLTACRVAGLPVFFTQHLSLPRTLMGGFQLKQAMAWQHLADPELVIPWFLPGNPKADLDPRFAPLPDEAVIQKITMSAFEGTYLPLALRDLGMSAFLIVGAAMEVGIEPSVRHATDLGLIPVVVVDACGAGDQAAAQRSIESLRFTGDAILVETEALLPRLVP